MTSFAVQGGKLILKNCKLLIGNPACCCDVCVPYVNSEESEITVPDIYSLPVTVQFTGSDGIQVSPFCIRDPSFDATTYVSVDGEFCFTEGCAVFTCSGTNGCVQSVDPPPGFTQYETLEQCEQNCSYLGVICNDWDYQEKRYFECRGPKYGMPGSEMGPATCEECNPECCPVEIEGTCFGSGANASIVADETSSPPGSIVEVILTRPGSDYARIGRGPPTLRVNGAEASFQLSGPLRTGRVPTGSCLPAPPPGPCDLPYWTIDSISIEPEWPSRLNYKDGDRLFINGPGVIIEESAEAIIHIQSVPPVLEFVDQGIGGFGSGAVLTATFTKFISQDRGGDGGLGGSFGEELWTVSSIEIVNPGRGYVPTNDFSGDFFSVNVVKGFMYPRLSLLNVLVTSVDEIGGITSVSMVPDTDVGGSGNPPLFYRSGGFINNVVTGVTVLSGGRYAGQSPSFPPDVSPVTVSVVCKSGANGGAVINAIVDTDTSSQKFGQIKELVLVSGGAGYSNDCSNPLP
jgi:hypothetical protein